MVLILILSFVLLIPLSEPLKCFYPPRGQLPIPAHCMDLTNAMAYAANLPGGNDPKDWGRRLPSTSFTEKLPKVYWLAGRGPATCAFELDVVPSEPIAVERFGLLAVANAAEKVFRVCMLGRSQIGSELLGETRAVSVAMVRTDMPRLEHWRGGGMETLALKNGVELQIASLNATKPATRGSVMQLAVDDSDER